MKLIVGLGNPGIKYRFSRHNIGFLVIERLAKEIQVKFNQRRFNSRIAQGRLAKNKVILIKPYTYMNLSGRAVFSFLKWARMNLEDLLVICDDVNLKFITLRIKSRGSSGGHKGLKSIIDSLGTGDFPRLRLGIAPVSLADKIRDLEKYVLGQFSLREKELIPKFIERAVEACYVWVDEGIEVAMRRFNVRNKE